MVQEFQRHNQDLAANVCPDRQEDFLRFTNEGVDLNRFGQHLKSCPMCKAAVEAALQRAHAAFEELKKVTPR